MTGEPGHNGWRDLEIEPLLELPFLSVLRERVATPTRPGGVEWAVVRRKEAAVVAPRRADGSFILVRQERVAVRRELWEFPAGQVDGEPTTAAILAAAHRELQEETGCRVSGELVPMGFFWASAGFTDERSHLFLATEVTGSAGGRSPDEHEAIVECRAFSPDALREMIAGGEICDANTLSLVARLAACGELWGAR